MTTKRSGLVLLSVLLLFVAFPAWADNPHCEQVGGVLMTNIGVIPFGSPEGTNLGPVFGDLKGSVAAEYKGNLTFHHYWVTASGETARRARSTLGTQR